MDFSLSGLASGFDWKTFVDQIIAVQHAPIDKLTSDKTTNVNKNAALVDLNTKLAALQASTTTLNGATLFTSRKAVSTTPDTTWTPFAAAGTAAGSYKIAVTQLATVAHRDGAADIGRPLNATDDVSGLTLAALPVRTPVTAGSFTVNGQKVTVALTDSLDQVFNAIATATSGAVTASYDHTTDKITLSGPSEIVLGAANDSSNFLAAFGLANNGTPTVTSSGALGTVDRLATLAGARLNGTVTAVDGAGNGSFTVNGVAIAYNLNTDSLDAVLQRINASTAGVTASYDSKADRVILSNAITGDTGIAVSEAAGGLLDALGLTGGSTLARGRNAEFTLNGGATLTSASNTLDETAHGIAGLGVTVDTESTQTITVSGDTAGMRGAIEDFIAKFNDVQNYIGDQSKISTTPDGKVTSAILASNREVQSWSDSLRSIAFGAVAGLSGTISRLENLGIDFTPGTSKLAIKDGTKLDNTLRDKAADVAGFFQTASTGLSAQLQAFLTKVTAQDSDQQDRLTKANSDIDAQILTLQRRLDAQKQLLTNSFIAMETAQSQLQTQAAALTRAFPTTSSSSK